MNNRKLIRFVMAVYAVVVGAAISIPVVSACNSRPAKTAEDYAYEAYCDSVYENDTDYFLDVISESDKYQEYIEKHGNYWEEYDTYKHTH